MPVQSFSVKDTIDQIASEIGDKAKRFVTLKDHVNNINMGIIRVSIATKSIETKFYSFNTTLNSYEFDLPRDFIRGDDKIVVLLDGVPLDKTQFGEYSTQSENMDSDRPVAFAVRRNKIVIYPPVGTDYVGKRLDVHCGQLADKVDILSLNVPMPVPTEMVPYVIEYARYKAWTKRRKTTRAEQALGEAKDILRDLRSISSDINRESPERFMTEQEALRLGIIDRFRSGTRTGGNEYGTN